MTTAHDDAIEWLGAAHRELGPWTPRTIEAPPGGPARLYDGHETTAWVAPAGRITAEREGHLRAAAHRASPTIVAASARALVFARLEAFSGDLVEAFASEAPPTIVWEGTRRRWLSERLAQPVLRALREAVPGRVLDRWLDRPSRFESALQPGFGGVHPRWFFLQHGRLVCLRGSDAMPGRALDLAGLSLGIAERPIAPDAVEDRATIDRLRALHRSGARDEEAADRAFELALVMVWIREHVRSRDAQWAERVRERIADAERPTASEVRVWIEAPPFVPIDAWIARQGATVPASRARWLLQNVDGARSFGEPIAVRTEPPIAKGRASDVREPRAVRRRRLFSRFDRGIRADDEGLFSATPEALALRLAQGARGVVIDGTCGIGALAIAYARQPGVTRVIAVDRDRDRLACAAHNAGIYEVRDRIEFVHADVFEVLAARRGDLVVLDPPWGGRDYNRARIGLEELPFDLARALARIDGPVVLKLPNSFDREALPARKWTYEAMVDERGILKFGVARAP